MNSTIIGKCKKKDREGQKELYELIAPEMFLLCLKLCRNHDDAENVLQQGFIKVFDNVESYSAEEDFLEWCRRNFINAFYHYYKIESNARQKH